MVYQETMHSQAMPTRDVNFANEKSEVAQMVNKVSSHPSVVRYGWGNEYYGVNHSSNRFERQYEDTANSIDPTRRATHGSPVTWADRHGPYCFYLSTVGPGQSSFPCYEQSAYDAYNNESQTIMNQEGPNNPMEWDEYGAAGSSSEFTISQVIPKEHRFPVNATSPDFIFHRYFDAVGAGKMWGQQDAYLPLFGPSDSLSTEVKVSQWTQNEGLRYANQAHRRHMPHRSMSAFWTLNEAWPNAAYGSVIDWFGVKKQAYYAGTTSAYAPVDVSLKYSNLFVVAGDTLPTITAHIVADWSPSGAILTDADLNLTVTTPTGKVLHRQSWRHISLSVPVGEIGAVVDLPAPVSFTLPAGLGGEVAICSLELSETEHEVTQLRARRQVYTFGILKPGSSVHDKMDAIQPMRPLLQAPVAQCKLAVTPSGHLSHSVTLSNGGTAPCLYMQLELRDPTLPADEPQFHAAEVDDNFVTLLAGESAEISFVELPCRAKATGNCDVAAKLQLCATGWNVPRVCVAFLQP